MLRRVLELTWTGTAAPPSAPCKRLGHFDVTVWGMMSWTRAVEPPPPPARALHIALRVAVLVDNDDRNDIAQSHDGVCTVQRVFCLSTDAYTSTIVTAST